MKPILSTKSGAVLAGIVFAVTAPLTAAIAAPAAVGDQVAQTYEMDRQRAIERDRAMQNERAMRHQRNEHGVYGEQRAHRIDRVTNDAPRSRRAEDNMANELNAQELRKIQQYGR